MSGRQQCPSCERRWEPPGPCTNLDGGEPCEYREPERPRDRPARTVTTAQRPAMPSDGTHATGRPSTTWREHMATMRAELARIAEAKESS